MDGSLISFGQRELLEAVRQAAAKRTDPTPEEIAAQCRAIRKHWSTKETKLRAIKAQQCTNTL